MTNNNEKVFQIDACINCNKTLREEWKFCPHCKTPIETHSCIYCGKNLKKLWEYCPYCKIKVNKDAELKSSYNHSNEWLRSILDN